MALLNCCTKKESNESLEKLTAPSAEDQTDDVTDTKNGRNAKNLRIKVPQPVRLRNLLDQSETSDLFHTEQAEKTLCTEHVCLASVVAPESMRREPRAPLALLADAEAFLRQFYASRRKENSEAHLKRLKDVRDEVYARGTYELTSCELVFGAKTAWRNASRCIGRIQWKKLQMFDCREVTTTRGMFDAICAHIKYSTNKGNIRSAITVFAPRAPDGTETRIWNPQFISYAGYQLPGGGVLGDPARVEITEIAMKLGWKPPYTAWDIVPLILSANGKDPEFFEIPRDIIMECHLEHPTFEWFKELQLRWYVMPAVSGMQMDCGGLVFPAVGFNGWYMSTEIACRNLCDTNRLNVLPLVAEKMGLDTSTNSSLWKDKALLEVNVAVLHSFHRDNVSIVDHHSASEQFMKHLDTENRTRGGCPADWVWTVPPMSSSLTGVFHQEMAMYYVKPLYAHQDPPWKNYHWKSEKDKPKQKFHFKQIARAVKVIYRMYAKALSKRTKATILYASETGKSEQYALELGRIFGTVFNAHVYCMADYDMYSIEHETILLIVTSTFGNGEPPANGMEFADHLFEMLYTEHRTNIEQRGDLSSESIQLPTPKTLMRANSILTSNTNKRRLISIESMKSKSSTGGMSNADSPLGPLSNISFAVFGLGSSAYPQFCNFAKSVDEILGNLGGERLLELGTGDELCGQEQQFHSWASNIFNVACEAFCLEETDMLAAHQSILKMPLTEDTVKFAKYSGVELSTKAALESSFKKNLVECVVKENTKHGGNNSEQVTIYFDIEPKESVKYDPGDHLGVMPCNRKEIVNAILGKLTDVFDYDKTLQLQLLQENFTLEGLTKKWERHSRLPPVSPRVLFTRYLDVTTPPSLAVLKYLSKKCTDKKDIDAMNALIENSDQYEDWIHNYCPNIAEVLATFPSCMPKGSVLAALLPSLQPRLYSISSSQAFQSRAIQLTVAVVEYLTIDEKQHYGVCSNYLNDLKPGDSVFVYTRRCPSFHMPSDKKAPMILIGPGTGIAPFRGFWQQRLHDLKHHEHKNLGPIWLFFGCRNVDLNLYEKEKEEAVAKGALQKHFLALSRDKNIKKTYVQDLLEQEGEKLASLIIDKGAHIYVCGDCKMAEGVMQKIKIILKQHGKMSDDEVSDYMLLLMDHNRYHEDIFGITLRTAEVRCASRETAKITRLMSVSKSMKSI